MTANEKVSASRYLEWHEAMTPSYPCGKRSNYKIERMFMCVGPPKTAEHLFLAALFFVSFFWASKRKKEKTSIDFSKNL